MTNDEFRMTEDASAAAELSFWGFAAEESASMEESPHAYDLEERTSKLGERVILFAKKIPFSPVNNRLIDQIGGAGASVGANYCEADDGVSRADFRHRIGICRKEARETKYFLRMIAVAEPFLKDEARELWREACELHLIFSRIWRSTAP